MAREMTTEEQIAQVKKDIDLLTQQLALLKAQTALDPAKQTQDALSAKALLDALKDQTVSQSALDLAKAQLPFADLQGIKAGLSGLTLPTGKEGTVKVAVGPAGTALLRSKGPMLELLAKIADKLAEICPQGAALVTEAQLAQVATAAFTLKRIEDQTKTLAAATKQATPKGDGIEAAFLPALGVAAYGLGFTLDTINSLIKLLRTNRQFDIFDVDTEAIQMLGYLLEAKNKGIIAKPAIVGNTLETADSLLEILRDLGKQLQIANDIQAKIQKYSDHISQASADDLIKKVVMPTEAIISLLKAEIGEATLLLDSLHPSKKPDAFWTQVGGQVLAKNIKDKQRLLIEAKAQVVQVTESRWYTSDRILATGEVQVAYRVLKPDGSLAASGVVLYASNTANSRIDRLTELKWSA